MGDNFFEEARRYALVWWKNVNVFVVTTEIPDCLGQPDFREFGSCSCSPSVACGVSGSGGVGYTSPCRICASDVCDGTRGRGAFCGCEVRRMVEHFAPAPVFAYPVPAPEVELPAPAPDLRDQRVRHVRGDPGCSVSFRFKTHDSHRDGARLRPRSSRLTQRSSFRERMTRILFETFNVPAMHVAIQVVGLCLLRDPRRASW